MSLTVAPIHGTPFIGGNAPGDVRVDSSGLQRLVKSNRTATVPPTATDDSGSGYGVGSVWWTTAGAMYLCDNASVGAAVWTRVNPGLTIDSTAISGGAANRILFQNGSGQVSQSANLTWDGTKQTITGPGSAGTAIARFNPASGTSYTQINDNGTVVIDSDVSTGSSPLNIKYNGTSLVQFGFGSAGFGLTAGSYPIGFGGGNGAIHTATGDFKIHGYTNITLRPNSTTSGSGSGSGDVLIVGAGSKLGINRTTSPGAQLHTVAGSATTKTTIAQAAASQSAHISEWTKSDDTLYLSVSENGYLKIKKNAAPADAEIDTSECALWFDNTNGAGVFNIKAKTADGTVVTGSVVLS